MSNTTTATLHVNSTITYSLDYYYALFINPIIVVRFYQIGYPITFILGFIGNIASLLTFSRISLRRVSTGCLFIVLALSDTLFLLMCVFDFVEFGLQVPFMLAVIEQKEDFFSAHRSSSIIMCDTTNSVDFVRLSSMCLKCYRAGHW